MKETGEGILVPKSGDFDAWPKEHDVAIAVDWDGTVRDTMVPKWTKGFNVALTEVWPALKAHQKEIDEVCWRVNMVDDTAGVQRFVALMLMMREWKAGGLPVPDLENFFAAVEHVEQTGEKHGVETYRRLMERFGYDDSPLRWSEVSDRHIEKAARDARVFGNAAEALEEAARGADLVVVSASKTEAVVADVVAEGMTGLFKAVCAQDFLPKKATLEGLHGRYPRTLFVGDTNQDIVAARETRTPMFLVRSGDEDASWAEARGVIQRFLGGEEQIEELIYS